MDLDPKALLEAHPLLGRFANVPAFLQPGSEAWLAACLKGHAAYQQKAEQEYGKNFAGPYGLDSRYGRSSADTAFARLGNVAVIPVRGSLLHGSMARDPYATGYDYIRLAAMQAEADEEVAGIVYLHNSNGGEVAGNFDLVDDLAKVTKPTVAIVDENSYSASYSLASAADKIVVARTGGVGSIGVLTAHVDVSQLMEKMGVDIEFIYAGKHKVDGNPFQPLGDSVKNRMQARIDGLYNEFVNTVARNRQLSPEAVRGTEALTYSAADALGIGLADAVQAPHEALAAFIDELKAKPTGAMTMSTEQTPKETATAAATSQADLDAARAEGASAERERIQGIMNSEEAKTRPVTAAKLAYSTGMSVADAQAFLADLPGEKPAKAEAEQTPVPTRPKGEGLFAAAMDASANPNITPDGESTAEQSDAQRILGHHRAVTGRKA